MNTAHQPWRWYEAPPPPPPLLSPRDDAADALPPDEDLGPVWLGVSTSLLALLLITTVLRLWARHAQRNCGWDDATIAASALAAAVRYSFGVAQLRHGNGRHRVYLAPDDYVRINMYGWWGQLFHFTSMACLKLSICLLVLRIMANRSVRVLVYVIMVTVSMTNFGVVVILLAECMPAGFWRGKTAVCWPNTVRIYAIWVTIAHSVLTDFVLSLLPLILVWKVRIPTARKALVMCLMSLGLISTAFGIVRAEMLGVSEDDLSWTFCIVAIWSNLELFLGIIAANLALSRAIYLHLFHDPTDMTTSMVRGGGTGWEGGSAVSTNPSSSSASSGNLHSRLRGDRFAAISTLITSGRSGQGRRISETRSSSSDVPLEPGIKKKTEFSWREEERSLRAAERGIVSPIR